jgi:ABC-type transport system involved in multi-copper enzyme maturation permease subunit
MAAATLARTVVLEARRGGLPWVALGALAATLALAAFLSQVAITEGRELQVSVTAALLRASAIFLLAAHVAASTLREADDKVLELLLALPIPRPALYLGRLAGLAACGVAIAVLFALPLLAWAPAGAVGAWALSLAAELAFIAAAALFFSRSLSTLVAAMSATAALYLLGRSMAAIQALAATPLGEPTFGALAARMAVDSVALLLPNLDGVTRTEWLLYGLPAPAGYLAALASLAIYAGVLVAAGLFDFQRRNA